MQVKVEGTRFVLSGPLSEESSFAPVLQKLATMRGATIDLAGITRINSLGVHEWVVFTKAIPASCAVELEGCTPAFVEQASMISNFLGRTRIKSFYIPYVCTKCGAGKSELVDMQMLAARQRPVCNKCGAGMDDDLLPEAFFAALRP